MTDLVIVGARSHAREVHEAVQAMERAGTAGWRFAGFIEEGTSQEELISERGGHIIGDLTTLEHMDPAHVVYVIGIGSPKDRKRIDERLSLTGLRAATVVHPTANVGSLVHLGPGSYVAMGANVTTQVSIGRHAHVNTGAVVSHDCRVGDYAIINPSASLAGGSTIEEGAYVGIGAIVFGEKTVGAWATVGAGTVVTKDVRPNTTVIGNPGRPMPTRTL